MKPFTHLSAPIAIGAALVMSAVPVLAGDDLRITSPDRSSIWSEGDTVEISWQAKGDGALCIAMRMGGKDLGLINDCETPAADGHYTWTVPEGRVTGFGPDHASDVHVALSWADGHGDMTESAPFTIAGYKPPVTASPEEAIATYYQLVNSGDWRGAYALLNPFDISLKSADGAQLHYQPRPDFFQWQENMAGYFSSAELLAAEDITARMNWARDPELALGIRRFAVRVAETGPDGMAREEDYFIDVAAGLLPGGDTAAPGPVYRILGINTGP